MEVGRLKRTQRRREARMENMKLIWALTLCSLLFLQLTGTAHVRNPGASDLLEVARKGNGDDGPCTMGRCDSEEDSEGFEERNLRARSDKNIDSDSASDSSMVPQEMLLPPTPAEGTTR